MTEDGTNQTTPLFHKHGMARIAAKLRQIEHKYKTEKARIGAKLRQIGPNPQQQISHRPHVQDWEEFFSCLWILLSIGFYAWWTLCILTPWFQDWTMGESLSRHRFFFRHRTFTCHRVLRAATAFCFNTLVLTVGLDYGWTSFWSQHSSLVIGFFCCHKNSTRGELLLF
jgi:hypothetical protein